MSGSVHINGNTRANMKSTLRQHQLRDNEEEGKKALKATESDIDPKLSHMNINYFDDPERFPKMREKIDTINEKRTQDGKKKMYKSANVFMTGTLQLSNESLQRLGWQFDGDDALPADKQPEHALKNVKAVYADMVQSVHKQPEVYGDVFSATLHMDESSPHVDFLSDPLDVDKPYQAARAFLNGPKGDAKRNVRRMQDNIFKHSRFDEATKTKYDLVRGEPFSKKKDKMKTIKKDEAEVKKAQEDLATGMMAAGIALQETGEKAEELDERENKLSDKAERLNEQESTLNSRKMAVEAKEQKADEKDQGADEKLSEAQNKLDMATEKDERATDKLSTAEKLHEEVTRKLAENEERLAEIQKENEENKKIMKELKRFGNGVYAMFDAIRNGQIGLRTANRTVNNVETPIDTQENLEHNNLVLDDLEDKQQIDLQR